MVGDYDTGLQEPHESLAVAGVGVELLRVPGEKLLSGGEPQEMNEGGVGFQDPSVAPGPKDPGQVALEQ